MDGVLVAGSDGLFNYADLEKVREIVREVSFESIPASLIDPARLRSGKLQDDCSVIIYTSHENKKKEIP